MAYDPLNDADLAAGKPTKTEIFQKIKANQEDFNSRINLLGGTAKIDMFDIRFAGKINQYSQSEIQSYLPVFKAPVDASIVSVVITLLSPSTSGTLSLQIEKSTDNGINWTPLLTTPVALTGTTTGSISGAVTFDGPTANEFLQNELIRIRFVTTQVNQGEFHVSIYAELSN